MLKHKTINDPYAVEKHFCEKFAKLPLRQFTDDEAAIFIDLTQCGKTKKEDFPAELTNNPNMKMLESALQNRFSMKITDYRILILIKSHAEAIGKSIQYLTYMQYWAKKHNVSEITFKMYWSELFPNGVPTERSLTWLHDQTKVAPYKKSKMHTTNLIDHQSAMKSIQFGVEIPEKKNLIIRWLESLVGLLMIAEFLAKLGKMLKGKYIQSN